MFALTRPPEDVSNPNVEFDPEPTATEVPEEIPEEPEDGLQEGRPAAQLRLGDYGYSKDRRKFLPASQAAAPAVLARLDLHRARSCSSSRR